jgi:hypothetical protein
MSPNATHQRGKSFPLGATLTSGGANFSVFAKRGCRVSGPFVLAKGLRFDPSKVCQVRASAEFGALLGGNPVAR